MLSEEELVKVEAGSKILIAGIAGAIVLLIGIIDGYYRPLKCN